MDYVEPEITNVLKADETIQGLDKDQSPSDGTDPQTTSAGYKADE